MSSSDVSWTVSVIGFFIGLFLFLCIFWIIDVQDGKTALHDGMFCKKEFNHQYVCQFDAENDQKVRIVFPNTEDSEKIETIEVR